MLTPNLKLHIDQLWKKFWGGGIANPLTAIEQITYLLFIKRIDELDTVLINSAKKSQKKYKSLFEGNYQPHGKRLKKDQRSNSELRWSYFSTMKGDQLLHHVQYNVFPFIKNLDEKNSPFVKSMQNAVFIMPKASLLQDAVKIIDELYKEIEKGLKGKQTFQDTQGDVYEYLLSEIASAGKMGQFRTPRHIIKLICDLVAPKITDKIADPACGTGGFLLGAFQYILTQYSSNSSKDDDGFIRGTLGDKLKDEKKKIQLQTELFHGFDIDPSMVRIGLMNLMMHGITKPNIENSDTLSKNYNENDVYDVILANPPFTGSIDKGDINKNLKLDTTKTELLFIERIYQMLKPKGTAAVIVPQGVLFGGGAAFKKTRQILIDTCELKAVITMPSGVFKPYAGVATAILIFTKAAKTNNVWFYEMESDGRSLDDKRTKLPNHGDIHDIVKKYKTKDAKKNNNRSEKAFFVPQAEIVAKDYDLSLNRYKTEILKHLDYEKPQVILKRIITIEKGINSSLEKLKKMI